MSEWQPIETAPKDGMDILLYLGGDMAVGYFSKYLGEWTDGLSKIYPTHWIPLPNAPT